MSTATSTTKATALTSVPPRYWPDHACTTPSMRPPAKAPHMLPRPPRTAITKLCNVKPPASLGLKVSTVPWIAPGAPEGAAGPGDRAGRPGEPRRDSERQPVDAADLDAHEPGGAPIHAGRLDREPE